MKFNKGLEFADVKILSRKYSIAYVMTSKRLYKKYFCSECFILLAETQSDAEYLITRYFIALMVKCFSYFKKISCFDKEFKDMRKYLFLL